MADNFVPAPNGPPTTSRQGKYDALYIWLESNPGEWAKVNAPNPSIVSTWKEKGYEAVSRIQPDKSYDLYVRKPKQAKPAGSKR